MGGWGSYFRLCVLVFGRHDHIGSRDPIGGCTDTGVRNQHLDGSGGSPRRETHGMIKKGRTNSAIEAVCRQSMTLITSAVFIPTVAGKLKMRRKRRLGSMMNA